MLNMHVVVMFSRQIIKDRWNVQDEILQYFLIVKLVYICLSLRSCTLHISIE